MILKNFHLCMMISQFEQILKYSELSSTCISMTLNTAFLCESKIGIHWILQKCGQTNYSLPHTAYDVILISNYSLPHTAYDVILISNYSLPHTAYDVIYISMFEALFSTANTIVTSIFHIFPTVHGWNKYLRTIRNPYFP